MKIHDCFSLFRHNCFSDYGGLVGWMWLKFAWLCRCLHAYVRVVPILKFMIRDSDVLMCDCFSPWNSTWIYVFVGMMVLRGTTELHYLGGSTCEFRARVWPVFLLALQWNMEKIYAIKEREVFRAFWLVWGLELGSRVLWYLRVTSNTEHLNQM